MTLANTSIQRRPPFGPAVVKRGLRIRRAVEEQDPVTLVWARKDISAARWTYRLRVWESDAAASRLVDEVIAKGAASSSGVLDHYHAVGTTVKTANLLWEIVEVDNDNADSSTTTGQREEPILRWQQPILDAP